MAPKKKLPRATHSGDMGIGGVKVPCAVLDDGTRILQKAPFLHAIHELLETQDGPPVMNTEGLSPFLEDEWLQLYLSDETRRLAEPICYVAVNGFSAFGYNATLFPNIIITYLDANQSGVLPSSYSYIVERCTVLIAKLAKVGARALQQEANRNAEMN